MSRWRERWRRRNDVGFTLVELVVALSLVGVAAAASTPLFISALAAASTSRFNTEAKNLAQERLESMRDLQYHVDRQNGPFVDLLDIYYTDLNTSPTTRTRANEVEVGQWYASGAPAPAPSGPVYAVSVAQLPGYPAFSQRIYTQFLSDVTGAAMPASALTGYNSQSEGNDQPRSWMVGVTVVTTWTDHGASHSFTTYTRITDTRGTTSSITSEGDGEFLRISATGSALNALTVDLAVSKASGGLSSGSLATADVKALNAVDASGQDYVGATGVSTSPSGATSVVSPVSAFSSGGGSSCGWVGSGPTQVSDVTAGTGNGLPQVPSDVGSGASPAALATAQLTSGANSSCGIFGFSNQSSSYASQLMLSPAVPLVRINNDSQNNVVVNGASWVNATPLAQTHSVLSGAAASATKRVQLFPGAGFVTDGAGVVDILLSQSAVNCSAVVTNGITTTAATGSWTATIDYWQATDLFGHGQRVTLGPYTWSSATNSGSADPLASINPSNIIVYQNGTTILRLSDYLASWSTARSLVENANSGLHQLNGVITLTTQGVRSNDPTSALWLQVGNLSCVADDER